MDTMWVRLAELKEMRPGETRAEQARTIIRHAEAAGDTALLARARIELLNTLYLDWYEDHEDHRGRRRRLQDLTLAYSRCLALYRRAPDHFSAQDRSDLQTETINITLFLLRSAEHPTARLRAILDEADAHWRDDHYFLFGSVALRMELEGRAGNVAAADAAMDRLHTLDPLTWDHAAILASWAERLIAQERDDEAIAALEPVIAGEVSVGPSSSFDKPQDHWPLLLIPYLRTGRLEQARSMYRRFRGHADDRYSDMKLEFLARSGNEENALEFLRHDKHVAAPASEYSTMNDAATVALVCRRLTELGHGAEELEVETEDASSHTVTAADHFHTSAEIAMAFARKADACHGNTYQSERVHALIHARPIVDHLPIP